MNKNRPQSHFIPRTRDGWIATIAFVALFLLSMPPVTHAVWNRPDVWIAGVPLFFGALLLIYVGLIAVLIWALRRGI